MKERGVDLLTVNQTQPSCYPFGAKAITCGTCNVHASRNLCVYFVIETEMNSSETNTYSELIAKMLQDYLLKYHVEELEEILDATEDHSFYSICVK